MDAVAQGLNPVSGNAENDLVNDYDELNFYHSNPQKADITGFTEVEKINAHNFSASQGQWIKFGNDVVANHGQRGWIEYKINPSKQDAYRLDLVVKQHLAESRYNQQELVVSIDGEFVQRIKTTLNSQVASTETIVTPVLTAGEHTVRIYWDNVYHSTHLELQALSLKSIDGPVTEGTSQKEWLTYRLDKMNKLDSFSEFLKFLH